MVDTAAAAEATPVRARCCAQISQMLTGACVCSPVCGGCCVCRCGVRLSVTTWSVLRLSHDLRSSQDFLHRDVQRVAPVGLES